MTPEEELELLELEREKLLLEQSERKPISEMTFTPDSEATTPSIVEELGTQAKGFVSGAAKALPVEEAAGVGAAATELLRTPRPQGISEFSGLPIDDAPVEKPLGERMKEAYTEQSTELGNDINAAIEAAPVAGGAGAAAGTAAKIAATAGVTGVLGNAALGAAEGGLVGGGDIKDRALRAFVGGVTAGAITGAAKAASGALEATKGQLPKTFIHLTKMGKSLRGKLGEPGLEALGNKLVNELPNEVLGDPSLMRGAVADLAERTGVEFGNALKQASDDLGPVIKTPDALNLVRETLNENLLPRQADVLMGRFAQYLKKRGVPGAKITPQELHATIIKSLDDLSGVFDKVAKNSEASRAVNAAASKVRDFMSDYVEASIGRGFRETSSLYHGLQLAKKSLKSAAEDAFGQAPKVEGAIGFAKNLLTGTPTVAKVMQFVRKIGDSPAARALNAAASRGGNAVIAAHALLMKNDSDYRKRFMEEVNAE